MMYSKEKKAMCWKVLSGLNDTPRKPRNGKIVRGRGGGGSSTPNHQGTLNKRMPSGLLFPHS